MINASYSRTIPELLMVILLYVVSNVYGSEKTNVSEKGESNVIQNVDNSGKPSDFNENFRDPFWRIGYFPVRGDENIDLQKAIQTQHHTIFNKKEWILARCKYGGTIERGRKKIAIINNQVVQKGDIIPINEEGKIYKIKVVDIETKSVKLTLLD
jgi:hypothetical protein